MTMRQCSISKLLVNRSRLVRMTFWPHENSPQQRLQPFIPYQHRYQCIHSVYRCSTSHQPLRTYSSESRSLKEGPANQMSTDSKSSIGEDIKDSKKNDPENHRFNWLKIQMLSKGLHDQVFKGGHTNEIKQSPETLEKIKSHLEEHGLWGKEGTLLSDVDLQLPKLSGSNIDEHFRYLGDTQSRPYREHAERLANNPLPEMPTEWKFEKGWTKYGKNGETTQVPYPDDRALVFDVEVLVQEGHYPTLATAASPDAWYSWCSDSLIEDHYHWSKNPTLDDLIPLETGKISMGMEKRCLEPRLVVGHNVGFDRSFVKEQYLLDASRTRFLDTMSMHISVGGLTSYQRILKIAKDSGSRRKELQEHIEESKWHGSGGGGESADAFKWTETSSLNNLNDVYQLYCKKGPLSKSIRDVFVQGQMKDVRDDFQNLMQYCASDVAATHAVFQNLWPLYLERFPHPVSLAGMLEMGTAYLPVNSNWQRYLLNAQGTYNDLQRELKLILMRLANDACSQLHEARYKTDPWLWDLDWSIRPLKLKKGATKKKSLKPSSSSSTSSSSSSSSSSGEEEEEETAEDRVKRVLATAERLPKRVPFMPGYPAWYRALCPREGAENWTPGPSLLGTQLRVTPKLLQLTWDGWPLYYDTTHGWGYIRPGGSASMLDIAQQEGIPVHELIDLCEPAFRRSQGEVSEGPGSETESRRDLILSKIADCTAAGENAAKLWAQLKREENKKVTKKPKPEEDGAWMESSQLPGFQFHKLPHKDGGTNKVGNPLAKDFLPKVEDGTLQAMAGGQAHRVLTLTKMCSYWKNNQDRLFSQMVVHLKKSQLSQSVIRSDKYDEDDHYGAIVPRVVSAGTVTRRASEPTWLTASNAYTDRVGSELKAMVQCPPGYHFVGADVDSQELWIAAIFGDAHFAGMHGSTAFGWMTLQGKKGDKTDLHSKTAATVGITRDQAKIFNYGRIYGAGKAFAKKLLMKFDHRLSLQDAARKANTMYKATKGDKRTIRLPPPPRVDEEMDDYDDEHFDPYNDVLHSGQVKKEWYGGTESHMFNMLESIALSPRPETPVLGARITQALETQNVKNEFMTSRVNWVVQSSAVDYLHLMLVCMRWLFEEYSIEGRFCISIHDEVRYLVKSEDRYRAALALQITNLLTRSMFAHKLGMQDLPQSVAFFSAVDLDTCLRKEVNLDCKTPSNPHGLERGYNITFGEALDIYEILERTNGSLAAPSSEQTSQSQAPDRRHNKYQQEMEDFLIDAMS